ncbi:MAG: M23 family metallopeptidase [Firmicutes bacterium]|nr:M23 family metallopeptidase [Bacillota bacterium]
MKKRKLKGFVLPTIYLLITISIFTGIVLLGSGLTLSDKDYNYSTGVIQDTIESVVVEDTIASSKIKAPIEEGKAEISVHFYSKDAEDDRQQSSLIYYENTYLPNTGVLYTSTETFNVLSAFSGKVIDILDDEFFGKCVVIEHTANLKSYYYGVEEIEVAVGDELTSGAVIGVSKNNEIMNNKKSFLFEVYHNNELINPETFIGTKVTDYN